MRWLLLLLGMLLLAPGASCGDDGSDVTAPAAPPEGRLGGHLTVLAAGSLTEAFTAIGEAFEGAQPDVGVTFSFGASSALAQQAVQGAPADLFASADPDIMQRTVEADAAGEPRVFARNRLAIVVRPGNPEGIDGLADLARSDLVLVVCAVEVPCGALAAEALDKAGVTAVPKSYEETVKGVVSRVALGEADAGIAYVTDARAAGSRVAGVEIPEAHNVITAYPLAVLEQSDNRDAARAFRDFVLGPEGQRILARHGFLAP